MMTNHLLAKAGAATRNCNFKNNTISTLAAKFDAKGPADKAARVAPQQLKKVKRIRSVEAEDGVDDFLHSSSSEDSLDQAGLFDHDSPRIKVGDSQLDPGSLQTTWN